MTDPARSALMARVRQRGTGAERNTALSLRRIGLSYRVNARALPGSPDFSNRKRKWAVFVNGCFWHCHTGCQRATIPKTNRSFWLEKFAANRRRDARAIRRLRAAGYRIVLVWECEAELPDALVERLSKILESRGIKR